MSNVLISLAVNESNEVTGLKLEFFGKTPVNPITDRWLESLGFNRIENDILWLPLSEMDEVSTKKAVLKRQAETNTFFLCFSAQAEFNRFYSLFPGINGYEAWSLENALSRSLAISSEGFYIRSGKKIISFVVNWLPGRDVSRYTLAVHRFGDLINECDSLSDFSKIKNIDWTEDQLGKIRKKLIIKFNSCMELFPQDISILKDLMNSPLCNYTDTSLLTRLFKKSSEPEILTKIKKVLEKHEEDEARSLVALAACSHEVEIAPELSTLICKVRTGKTFHGYL